jgi:hypothetical protein
MTIRPLRRRLPSPLAPALLLLPAVLSGCARRAPAFNVLGSFFPGWIACIVAGIVLTVILRAIIVRLNWERLFKALPLVYLALCILFACTLWLIFFE